VGFWHFAGFLFLSKFIQTHKIKFALIFALTVFVAWSFKIQYAYFIAIPSVVVFINSLLRKKREGISTKEAFGDLGISTAFLLAFAVLYYLIWYLPNKGFYDLIIMIQQHFLRSTNCISSSPNPTKAPAGSSSKTTATASKGCRIRCAISMPGVRTVKYFG